MNFKKKISTFVGTVIFAFLDPDPNSESGSTDPIESGSGSATLILTPKNCFYALGIRVVDPG
jgi:hypothetical protein